MSYNAFKERLERDKTPKSLFVEMDVLKEDIWQEQARWIKFEEDLMEGADRWGNPHVSSLSFHSLINLRLVLERCESVWSVVPAISRSLLFPPCYLSKSFMSFFRVCLKNVLKPEATGSILVWMTMSSH